MWHLDGYHKLIRWGIVIHDAGMDILDYHFISKQFLIIRLQQYLAKWFLGAVREYGLLSRVKCDKGGENTLVSQYILNHPARGPGRRSCITGRGVAT